MISQNKILRLLLLAFAICFLNEKSLAQMEFVQNKGQWNSKVNYKGDFSTGSFFLENKGFTVLMNKPEDVSKLSEYTHGHGLRSPKDPIPSSFILHSFAYNVSFLGASANPVHMPDKPLPTYNNYFIGNNQKNWAADCKIYTAITYKNVYPNIDVRYYSTADKLKYDFIVHPGGNPAAIAMRFDGGVTLNIKNKELIIGTPVGEVKEMAPYSYQTNVKGATDINTRYIIQDNVVSFNIGKYDPNATLIIDPQIVFSSFTGSFVDNWGYTATPGPDGSFFAGGIVFGTGYPVSLGAFQTIFAGGVPDGDFAGIDMAIFKFSANGSTRLYATYIGGAGNEQPHSMITDAAGNLIIAGRSNSSNYPVRGGISLASTNFDIVVTKLNSAGTVLIGSVKIGGTGDDGVNIRAKYAGTTGTDRLRRNYGDDARSEVIIDKSNNVYVVSCTQSINFPTLLAGQSTPQGSQDGVILKFNADLSGLLYSTLFGGIGDDACFVAAINPSTNNLFVGGATSSNNLPGNTSGTISPNYNGNIDGFVTEIPSAGGPALRTTYLGTGFVDLVYGLKFDRLGFPYVMGTSTGTWPVINATYQVPGSKQFIAKLQPNLSAYVYSTKFGTSTSSAPNISPIAFLVDRCENVYVSGWGGGLNIQQNYSQGSTGGLPQVNPLIGIPNADGSDFYFFVLRKDAQSQLFGSHFGQNQGLGDHVDGGTSRFDDNGVIYQAMCANCGGRTSSPPISFPTTPGVWAGINGSRNCNEAAVKIEMNFAGVGAEIQSEIDGEVNDSLACIGSTVNFKDLKAKGITYYWNFNCIGNCTGVDATTTTPQTSFTFNTVGIYRVRLIAEDLSTCNLRDTSYITIRIGQDKVVPSFTTKKIGPCTSRTFEFTNTSTTGISFLPQTFVWDFGDGSPVDTADFGEIITHPYAATGTYNVKLRAFDTRFCNAPKDTIIPLRINDNVKAIPETNALGCALYTPIFQNKSLAGLSWKWELLDATTNVIIQTSTDFVPTFTALNIGLYKYRLIAFDSTTCNKIDTSAYFNIEVVQRPQASADWAPNPPQANVPVRFSNFSTFANNYVWLFGDGETSTEFQPTHEYNATGTYTAKLVAISIAGCTDTFPLIVNVIINPLLDVPNAFTPGRFGINSIVSVRGFGIGKMDWRIFNRWGQLIFRSSNKKQGWDGFYKGKLQPIDVYSYSLDVEFTDGKRMQKTGDITLLR